MILAFRVNFGPLRAKISKIGWGTPTFYWTSRLYLPIGTQKCPYFCLHVFFHFGLGSKSQERLVGKLSSLGNSMVPVQCIEIPKIGLDRCSWELEVEIHLSIWLWAYCNKIGVKPYLLLNRSLFQITATKLGFEKYFLKWSLSWI